jgi:hypothetical protein
MIRTTDLDFMEVLKIRERFVAGAMEQVEIMGKAARALVRIKDEMQEQIDHTLLRPPASSKAEKDDRRLEWSRSSRRVGCARRWRRPRAPWWGWRWLRASGWRRRLGSCCRRMAD